MEISVAIIAVAGTLLGVVATQHFENNRRAQGEIERIASEGRAFQRTTIFEIQDLTWDLIRRAVASEMAWRQLEREIEALGKTVDALGKSIDDALRSADEEMKRLAEPPTADQEAIVAKLAEEIVAEVIARNDPSSLDEVLERRLQPQDVTSGEPSPSEERPHIQARQDSETTNATFERARADVKRDYLDGLSVTENRIRQLSARLLDDDLRSTTLRLSDLGSKMITNPVGSEGFPLHAQAFRNELQTFEREMRTYLDGEVSTPVSR